MRCLREFRGQRCQYSPSLMAIRSRVKVGFPERRPLITELRPFAACFGQFSVRVSPWLSHCRQAGTVEGQALLRYDRQLSGKSASGRSGDLTINR